MSNTKLAGTLQENDWIEIGGLPYQVEKPTERNMMGEVVIYLRPTPERSAEILMVVREDLKFELSRREAWIQS